MPRVLKRPQAEADLDDIWWYIAQDSPQNADRFLDRIHDKCLVLAEFPQMGVVQDDLKPNLRSFSVGNYLIFYFPIEGGIDVVRVLQGARDIEGVLFP
jgi:toxin ParE1/3/4